MNSKNTHSSFHRARTVAEAAEEPSTPASEAPGAPSQPSRSGHARAGLSDEAKIAASRKVGMSVVSSRHRASEAD